MDIHQDVNYMFSRDGQPYGPFEGAQIMQMAQKGQVLVSDYIWTEGMAEWIPAGYFHQLAPIFGVMITSPTIQPQPSPAESAHVVETAVDDTGAVHVKRTGVSGPGIKHANIQTGSVETRANRASHPNRPGASFGLVAFSFLLWVLGMLAMVCVMFFSVAVLRTSDPDEVIHGSEILAGKPYIWPAVWILFLVGLLFSAVVTLKYLYRAWAYIQDVPHVTTTPGKAVGFLFIPLFNVIWLFIAYYKWASDYNVRCDYADPVSSVRANEGLFLVHCILTLISVGFLTYLPVMNQMCRAINRLAVSPELEIDPNAGYSL